MPKSASTIGTVKFCIFNIEYEYTTDYIAELLDFPYKEGLPCEASLEYEWGNEACFCVRDLTSVLTYSFEGNHASAIHNPITRDFCQMLADINFWPREY